MKTVLKSFLITTALLLPVTVGIIAVFPVLQLRSHPVTKPISKPIEAPLVVALPATSVVECLAKNIYHEARNQSEEGMAAIAHVTLNRLHSKDFPTTVCEVVYEMNKRPDGRHICQFSWTCSEKLLNGKPANAIMWKKSQEIAERILKDDYAGNRKDITFGALFYHANYVRPHWRWLTRICQIGDHIFYIEK